MNTCIMVRHFNKQSGHIKSGFWKLRSILKEATAERLYNEIKKSFKEHDIPDANIVGFGSDGCNTMMGSHNSVASRIRTDCPSIIIVKCICHSAHLCASEACKSLSKEALKKAPKRLHNQYSFKHFLILHRTKCCILHKLAGCLSYQWLIELQSSGARLQYFLQIWPFQMAVSGQLILNWFRDLFLKLYGYFLQWIPKKHTRYSNWQLDNVSHAYFRQYKLS